MSINKEESDKEETLAAELDEFFKLIQKKITTLDDAKILATGLKNFSQQQTQPK